MIRFCFVCLPFRRVAKAHCFAIPLPHIIKQNRYNHVCCRERIFVIFSSLLAFNLEVT